MVKFNVEQLSSDLSTKEIKRMIKELKKEEDFILANLSRVEHGHESLEETCQLLDYYESLI